MAATGKTPILLYGSTTATNTPVAGNLTNSSDGCEIAINVADKNLFFKDSTNVVNTVPIRQSSASSNGWLSSTDWNTFNGKQAAGSYALTTGTLAQFASTTSAQLAGVISDETGSGVLVFGTSPTIATPTLTGNITASTGNLVIGTSGKGIDFSATANSGGTMTSELLADYEEGTWTPTVIGSTSAGTATYAVRVGRYTKIGNRVLISMQVGWSAGTGTGNLKITGLPYTSNSTNGNVVPLVVYPLNLTLTANYIATTTILNNATQIDINQIPVGGGADAAVAYDAAAYLFIEGHYEV